MISPVYVQMPHHNTRTRDAQCYLTVSALRWPLAQFKIYSSQFHHLFFLPFPLLSWSSSHCLAPPLTPPPPAHQAHVVLGGILVLNPCSESYRGPHMWGCSGLLDLLPHDFYCICHQVVGCETTSGYGEATLAMWMTPTCGGHVRCCPVSVTDQLLISECKLGCCKNDDKLLLKKNGALPTLTSPF